MRRLLDICVSGLGILLLLPAYAAIALAVKLQDGGPIVFRAVRVGKEGRLFPVYKFRTMSVDAVPGRRLTLSGDPRVTTVGAFLRRHKLDELPQLVNVLKGDMSVVGPRPEDPRYVRYYTQEQRNVLKASPGITSPASLQYKNETELLTGDDWEHTYTHQILQNKLTMELHYLSNRSLAGDFKVIIQTLGGLR